MAPQGDPSGGPVPADRSGGVWSRRLYGSAVAVLGVLALSGLAAGVLSQVVIGAEYSREVEAELLRPLIVPSLVAVLAVAAGAVTWWAAFVRKSVPPWVPAPFLATTAIALAVAFAMAGPSEAELEERWTKRLSGLRLPDAFAPRPPDPSIGPEDYRVTRSWTTTQDPAVTCLSLQQALSAWFGVSVEGESTSTCLLSAVDGHDRLSVSLDSSRTPRTLIVGLEYAL